MTMPFVVSWSCMEAMSMGATLVASDVASVREVVKHGETGVLVDFFKPDHLANQVVDVLENPAAYAHMGRNARKLMQQKYDFMTVCLPEHLRQIARLTGTPFKELFPGA
jgi:glycosyltransferase involved in cell wall biosynthesis